ncbi:hypothetical protein NMG60_11033012 [Bertholletia excelsa]
MQLGGGGGERERERERWRKARVVKHILLAKFKDGTPPEKIQQLIKGYGLVSLIGPMKAFHWGRYVSIENLHQGFIHVFESTFESLERRSEYVSHPAHIEFANTLIPHCEKYLVVDYMPEPVQF